MLGHCCGQTHRVVNMLIKHHYIKDCMGFKNFEAKVRSTLIKIIHFVLIEL